MTSCPGPVERRSTESPETLLTFINSRSETECQAHRSRRRRDAAVIDHGTWPRPTSNDDAN